MLFDSWQRKLGKLPARILGNDVQGPQLLQPPCSREELCAWPYTGNSISIFKKIFFFDRLVHLVSKQLLLRP